MKKKCSKALKKRSADYTSKIFEDCVREVLGLTAESTEDVHIAMDFIRTANLRSFFDQAEDEEVKKMVEAKTQVDELYQKKISELSTKILNEILKAHELQDGLKRTGRTLDTILSELARREILGDTSESDFIINNGDVDGTRKKSKSSSKKATDKRSKASTNR